MFFADLALTVAMTFHERLSKKASPAPEPDAMAPTTARDAGPVLDAAAEPLLSLDDGVTWFGLKDTIPWRQRNRKESIAKCLQTP